MQAGERDLLAPDPEPLHEGLDRGDMRVGDGAFQFGLRLLRLRRVGDDGAQGARRRLGIGEGRGRPGLDMRLAVAADERDVDPVHRRAADDADRGGEGRGVHRACVCEAPGVQSTSERPKSLAARAATKR